MTPALCRSGEGGLDPNTCTSRCVGRSGQGGSGGAALGGGGYGGDSAVLGGSGSGQGSRRLHTSLTQMDSPPPFTSLLPPLLPFFFRFGKDNSFWGTQIFPLVSLDFGHKDASCDLVHRLISFFMLFDLM